MGKILKTLALVAAIGCSAGYVSGYPPPTRFFGKDVPFFDMLMARCEKHPSLLREVGGTDTLFIPSLMNTKRAKLVCAETLYDRNMTAVKALSKHVVLSRNSNGKWSDPTREIERTVISAIFAADPTSPIVKDLLREIVQVSHSPKIKTAAQTVLDGSK